MAEDSQRKPRVAIVHVGSQVAQPKLFPVGKEYRVSITAAELLDDFRQAACVFGASSSANEVADSYVAMQMRFAELASYVSTIEAFQGVQREKVLKF